MDGYSRTMQWLQRKSTRLPIFVQDPQIFWSNEGAKIVWTPLPYYPSQRRKSYRSCKNYWKTRSRKSFWREQRRRWKKQDWSAVRLRRPKLQKKLDLAAREYTVAHCAETIFQRPKNDPFPIPNGGGRLTINRKRGNACLECVFSRRNRKKSRWGA